MSKKKNYTIETVISSSKEYGSGSVDGQIVLKQAPFSLRPYMARFRKGCVPYMVGSKTALDFGMRMSCNTVASSSCCAVTSMLSGNTNNGAINHVYLGTSIDLKNEYALSPNGWSMAFWLKTTVANGVFGPLYFRGKAGDYSQLIGITSGEIESQKLVFDLYAGDVGAPTARATGSSTNIWTLAVFQVGPTILDGVPWNSGSIIVVSGTDDFTTSYTQNMVDTSDGGSSSGSYIAAVRNSADNGFESYFGPTSGIRIADMAIWNYALTTAQITGTLWNGGKPLCLTDSTEMKTGLLNWWRMGDGPSDGGGIIYDQTGSANGHVTSSVLFNTASINSGDSIYNSCS
jgi:hypothetical protein